jgi:hypothetical protein
MSAYILKGTKIGYRAPAIIPYPFSVSLPASTLRRGSEGILIETIHNYEAPSEEIDSEIANPEDKKANRRDDGRLRPAPIFW